MNRRRPGPTPGRVAAALLGLAVFVIYLWTAAPTVLFGDSGELQTVALVGGVGHPSGYPTFMLLGHLFGRLIPGDAAHRITVMSALFGGVAALGLALLMLELGLSVVGATAGVLLFASSYIVWWSAIRTEVYTLAMACFAFCLWMSWRALRSGSRREAFLAALLFGLTLTSHMAYALPGLCLAAALLWRFRPGQGRGLAGWASLASGGLTGLLPIAYLVYEDSRTAATNYLVYTVDLPSHQFGLTAATFHAAWQRVPWLVFGRETQMGSFLLHPRTMAGHLVDQLARTFLFEYGPLALVLLAAALWYRRRRVGVMDLIVGGGLLASLFFGIASSDDLRMTPIYTMPFHLLLGIYLGVGVQAVLDRFGALPGAVVLPLLAITLAVPHVLRVSACDHPIGPRAWRAMEEGPPEIRSVIPRLDHYREPRTVSEACLRLTPQNSFVCGDWNTTRALLYLQQVEGRRRDLVIDKFYFPWHLYRIQRWQQSHDPARYPLVGVGTLPILRAYLSPSDSFQVARDVSLYIQRSPVGLPGTIGRTRDLPTSSR